MRTDGRTDMAKLVVAFRNFVDAPKKKQKLYLTSVSERTPHFEKFSPHFCCLSDVTMVFVTRLAACEHRKNRMPPLAMLMLTDILGL